MNDKERVALAARFAPHEALAAQLLPYALEQGHDIAHDPLHLARVWRTACAIAEVEGGDLRRLAAATILHDCVPVAKTSPDRPKASLFAAERAGAILAELGWDAGEIAVVAEAIRAHSFSAGLTPESAEARALHDADRIDGIGAVGVARCLMLSGALGRALYDPDDVRAETRTVDETRWTLDHFGTKLLRVIDSMTTETGTQIARARHERTRAFYEDLIGEVAGPLGVVPVLPDRSFQAEHVEQTETLVPARRALAFDVIGDQHLDASPMREVSYDTLFTYLHRRFGPPSLEGDDIKDLAGSWLLSTPDPELFVIVSPSLIRPRYSFSPYMACPRGKHELERGSLPPERVETLSRAYRTVLADLLRPVRVNGDQFNALGIVEDDDPLNGYDDDTEDYLYTAPSHASSGCCVPLGVFGTEAWNGILNLAFALGRREIGKGLEILIDLGRAHLFEVINAEPEPVRLLVAAGGVGPKHAMVLERIDLGLAQRALASEIAAALLGRKREVGDGFVMPDFTDEETRRATNLLMALDIDAPMADSLDRYRFSRQCQRIWQGLLAVVDGNFPDAAIPKGRWVGQTTINGMLAELRDAGRADIADYIDTVLAEDGGSEILETQLGTLFNRMRKQGADQNASPGP